MSIEISVLPEGNIDYQLRFKEQFNPHAHTFEGVWIRTQEETNRNQSGWESLRDRRVRMVHFKDKYDVIQKDGSQRFILSAPYMWYYINAPHNEIDKRVQKVTECLSQNARWVQTGDKFVLHINEDILTLQIKTNTFDTDYSILEATILSNTTGLHEVNTNYPWGVLRAGIRDHGEREKCREFREFSEILDLTPMQVELGSGTSTEAGIPPFRRLHNNYYVSDESGTFIFNPVKDKLLDDLICDPVEFYRRASEIYLLALTAEPTRFYSLLKDLYNKGIIVGPIITNNIDGLGSRLRLPVEYVREIAIQERGKEAEGETPKFVFHPDAKSLLVIGSHADRRGLRKAARNKGLQLIYVDPEKIDIGEMSYPYPLEELHSNDILLKMTADEFAQAWITMINKG